MSVGRRRCARNRVWTRLAERSGGTRRAPMGTRREPVRALVIDDDTGLAEAILDALGAVGIFAWALRPTASSSPASVARTAVAFRPDVVLLDVVMPVDAERLLVALQARPELARTAYLGCSGHSARAGRLARRLDGFLHKPFDASELVDAVRGASRLRRPPPGSCRGAARPAAAVARGEDLP